MGVAELGVFASADMTEGEITVAIKVGILGAKGFASGEAIRLLLGHPEFEIGVLMGRVDAPEPVANYFPELRDAGDYQIVPMDLDALAADSDIIILGLPHMTAAEYAGQLSGAGVKLVDLSSDFRFDSLELYEKTYGLKHVEPKLLGKFAYALPELFGDAIPGAGGLACPGCYPTAALLGLAPLTRKAGSFDFETIVIDALTGVTGAGRKVVEENMFTQCHESLNPYAVGGHRHRPEIEEKLGSIGGCKVAITFTAHLVPINRGILSTATVRVREDVTAKELRDLYIDFYKDAPFVRLLPEGEWPSTAAVERSNYCDIAVTLDQRGDAVIINSTIDNLTKGTSGQAIQSMNLWYGFPETLGLLPSTGRMSHA